MIKPGDFVVPNEHVHDRRGLFRPSLQSIGVVLFVKPTSLGYDECVVLGLYASPYANRVRPTSTYLTSCFYKLDAGQCRNALETFLYQPNEKNADVVYNLAKQYAREHQTVASTQLTKTDSFQHAKSLNPLRGHPWEARFLSFDKFEASREKHIQELMSLNLFERLFIPFLTL